ncbi:RpiB/LacA/LacB family sugar-phosphate isomerase [Candidatus Microgenomates bacterium]|nr:MAG: RpiB/LacA/LacB family sugar-phosphate isomerase [Candidatus Microgenomates bacterium]
MKIYIGADHRGFALKQKLTVWLMRNKYDTQDLGAHVLNEGDDYTTYASHVASMVADTKNSRGVLICGSGVGVDVVSNKFDGIRASIGKSTSQVKAGRADDDMNVLVIAADYTSVDESKKMLKAFLSTEFDGLPRHKKRLDDIAKIEENN